MTREWRGVPPPEGPGVPVYAVLAPKPGETHDLTILDSLILGTPCHWVSDERGQNGRSRLCTQEMGDCPLCGKARNLWLGWLAVLNNGKRTREVLRLGRESAVTLSRRAVLFSGLRGLRLKVTRSVDRRTSSLLYEDSPLAAGAAVPQAHKIEPTICLVLGTETLPDYRFTEKDLREGTA